MTASQIKGEEQPLDFTDSVQLKSDKLDECQRDGKAKDELITKLLTQVTDLKDASTNFRYKLINRSTVSCITAFSFKKWRSMEMKLNECLEKNTQPIHIDWAHCIGNRNRPCKRDRVISLLRCKV